MDNFERAINERLKEIRDIVFAQQAKLGYEASNIGIDHEHHVFLGANMLTVATMVQRGESYFQIAIEELQEAAERIKNSST